MVIKVKFKVLLGLCGALQMRWICLSFGLFGLKKNGKLIIPDISVILGLLKPLLILYLLATYFLLISLLISNK